MYIYWEIKGDERGRQDRKAERENDGNRQKELQGGREREKNF